MQYRSGKPGRIFIACFENQDDVIRGLEQIARDNGVRAAHVQLVGALQKGDFVAGPEEDSLPPKPIWRHLSESHEVLAFGTIFWDEEGPRVHLHGAFGKADAAKVGCLRENSRTFLVLEAVVTEIVDVEVQRALDPKSGLVLLRIEEG